MEIDKRGRPIDRPAKTDLKRYYKMEEEDDKDDDDDDDHEDEDGGVAAATATADHSNEPDFARGEGLDSSSSSSSEDEEEEGVLLRRRGGRWDRFEPGLSEGDEEAEEEEEL